MFCVFNILLRHESYIVKWTLSGLLSKKTFIIILGFIFFCKQEIQLDLDEHN